MIMTYKAGIEAQMTELVRLIEEEIDKHKWSLREAEEKLKLSRSTLSKLLTGKTHFPDLTTFEKLATYFGYSEFRVEST